MFKRYYCIKQKELKDCGCACRATISKQHGLKIPIYKTCELAKINKQETSGKAIIEVLRSFDFRRRKNKEDIYDNVPV